MGKASSFSSNDPSDSKHDQKLQAVLLADTFDNAWHPITLDSYDSNVKDIDGRDKSCVGWQNDSCKGGERPLILCPLNNVPVIKHSIDFLQGSGVEELFILCCSGADALEKYISTHADSSLNRNYSKVGTTTNNKDYNRSNSSNGSGYKIFWSSKLSITLLRFTDCTNPGDALRELDRRNIIKSDPFILMQGDVVTNVDVREALIHHATRKKRDSAAIMTVLLAEVGGWGLDDSYNDSMELQLENPNSPSDYCKMQTNHCLPPLRSSTDDLLLALDETKGPNDIRILLWDSNPNKKSVSIPTSFFVENSSNITLTRNYLDIGLDICSPDVLARFSDEFDYRYLRSQFVANCVSEEEVGLQSRIFAHLLKRGEYAGRPLGDMRRYHIVSMDILKRWCYPLVPDNYHNIAGDSCHDVASYVCERHYVYRHVGNADHTIRSDVGTFTQLIGPLLLGPNNHIGGHCVLQRSTLGPNCRVMDHCSVIDSHLWGNVLVEDGAKLNGVIVCEGAIIKKGAVIERGCVIGKGCIVGEGVRLKEFTRITMVVEVEEDEFQSGFGDSSSDEELSSEENGLCGNENKLNTNVTFTNHDAVGLDGLGRVWTPSPMEVYDSDEDGEEAQVAAAELMKSQSIGYDMILIYRQWKKLQTEDNDDFSENGRESDDEADDIDVEADWNIDSTDLSCLNITTPSNLDKDSIQITGRQKGVDVVKELRDICLEHEISNPVENLRIELNSFKFSQNATYADCCKGTIMAVMEKIFQESDSLTPGKLVSSLVKMLQYWGPLLKCMCIGSEEEKSIIFALESMALGGGKPASALATEPAFRFVLQTLHDKEVVNEEAIFEWAAERKNDKHDSPQAKLFFQKPTQDFLEWLQEDEEDSDEDADDTETGDDDSTL